MNPVINYSKSVGLTLKVDRQCDLDLTTIDFSEVTGLDLTLGTYKWCFSTDEAGQDIVKTILEGSNLIIDPTMISFQIPGAEVDFKPGGYYWGIREDISVDGSYLVKGILIVNPTIPHR